MNQEDRPAVLLHPDDDRTNEELAGTTETENQNGVIRYNTPIKDRDHRTDSLRACIRAILSLESEEEHNEEVGVVEEFGFMDVEPGEPYETPYYYS
jgi:hypothetical protein